MSNQSILRAGTVLLSLAALTFGASPASAGDVSGWYVGIYGGAAATNDVPLRGDAYFAQLFGPGIVETPTGYVNDGGLDADFFDFLASGPDEYEFADFGYASALLTDGVLDIGNSATAGIVAGYGFGNGFRVEGDLSVVSFSSGLYAGEFAMFQDADGWVEPTGEWVWSHSGEFEDVADTPVTLEEDFGVSFRRGVVFLLASAYYDIDTGTALTPYVGAGIGAALVTTNCLCATSAQTHLSPAGQLGAGVKVAVNDKVAIDFGYRFKVTGGGDFHATDTTFDGFGSYEGVSVRSSGLIAMHTIQLGVTLALK
ncbi:MAG: hypothetical protein JWR75_1052 [Devosia sp.]|nr:hypothetical protein [Devosia sp.]